MGKSPRPKTKWPLLEDERFKGDETYTRDRYTHGACICKKRKKVIRQILRKKLFMSKMAILGVISGGANFCSILLQLDSNDRRSSTIYVYK